MKIYLAPMEGITGEVYRRAYHTFFEPMDKYFTPFLNPNPKGKFSRQEWNEILPENNEGMYTVPQILTNRAEDFIRLVIIPGLSEPPVRTLRATCPENESHIFR